MQELVREIPLANGLTFRFFDATRRYFGDYHQVRIKISCEVPVSRDCFDDGADHDKAVQLLGSKVEYVKEMEHQGVATDALSDTVAKVIQHFVDHSLAYFENDSFPKKFVRSELNRIRSKGKGFFRPRGNG